MTEPTPVAPIVETAATDTLSAARKLRVTLGATVLLGGAGFASGILVNRLLGPDGRGQLAAVQTAPALLAVLGTVGMAEALVYTASRRPQRSRALLVGAGVAAVAGSAVTVLAGWVLLGVVLRAQSAETLHIARMYLFGVPLLILLLVVPSLLRARGAFVAWNGWRIAPAMLWTLVVVFASISGRDKVTFLAYGHLVLLLLLVAPLLITTWRRATGSARPTRPEIRSLVAFGLPTAAQAVPQLLNLRLDQFVISATLPGTDLGLYAAAVNWCVAITLLMDACGFVLFPSLAAIDDDDERLRRFCASTRIGVAVAIALAIAMAAATALLFTVIYGHEFDAALPAAFVLVAANAVLGYARVLADGVRGLGAPTIALFGELAGLAVTATALASLLSPFGIEGAAVASLLGYTTIVIVILRQVTRRFGVGVGDLVRVRADEVRRAARAISSSQGPRTT